jgi:UDP-glucuronate decarboxylase
MSAAAPAAPAQKVGLSGLGAARMAHGHWRVAVVGAGGWLGLATLELLHGLFADDFDKRVISFGSEARTLALRGGLRVDQRAVAELADLSPVPTLVLHLAFLTQEKATSMAEADYVGVNRALSETVIAALDRIGAEGVFIPSSGAVYKIDDTRAQASMRLYGALKLEDEERFGRWADARGRRAVIARVFNLSGPYINKQSSYALACFIADALAGRPIHIRADRPVFRSYVAISELMSVVFGALTDDTRGAVIFDTAGEAVLEMDDIAQAVRKALLPGLAAVRAPIRAGAPDHYVGDGAAYAAMRRRYRVQPVTFPAQVEQTARYMAGRWGLE